MNGYKNRPTIDPVDRQFIERTKEARTIDLTINSGQLNSLHLKLPYDRKLYHDIAIAIQDYYVKHKNQH